MTYIVPKNQQNNVTTTTINGCNIIEYTGQLPIYYTQLNSSKDLADHILQDIYLAGSEVESKILNALLNRVNSSKLDSIINEE
jgi:hypothetical protein